MGDDATSDRALLDAWRAGDLDAGERLIRRHLLPVHGYLERVCRGAHPSLDAADLAQRTFEAAVAGRDRVESEFRAYLYGIARNQLRAELQRLRRTEADTTPSKAFLRDARTSPSAAVARNERDAHLHAAVADLPPPFAEVLRMFYLEGLSVAEIVARADLSPGTVKSRLHRGRNLLRERLGDDLLPRDPPK